MITLRPSNKRGYFNHGWLKSYHTFSFADYYDPNYLGYQSLRVINEDIILPDQGFATHGHQNMEIVTYVISGELSHKDSMGNGSKILPGDIQYMSAGSGVRHSEFSHGSQTETHLLQIWLLPHTQNTQPSYNQKNFDRNSKVNKLKLIISPDGRNDSIAILNRSSVYVSVLTKDTTIQHTLDNPHGYLQIISGQLDINGQTATAGDGAFIQDEKKLTFKGFSDECEFLFFDLK